MSGAPPLVTIGITSYRAGATIARAIESAFEQDYSNTEIIIVDDGSDDGSVAIIEQAIVGKSRVRLIVHDVNKGVGASHNTILANANGEFLCIFDDDDVSVPDRISKQMRRITSYEERAGTDLVLCHAARIQRYNSGLERYEATMGMDEDRPAPHGESVARRVLLGDLGEYGMNIVGSCANCSRMGRLSVFRKLNGFDPAMRRAEDTDFSIRFALAGGHFVGIAEPLVYQTMTVGDEKALAAEETAERHILQKFEPYLRKIGWYQVTKQWLDLRYAYYRGHKIRAALIAAMIAISAPIKFVQKLKWAAPAADTRNAYKDWKSSEWAPEREAA